MNRDDRGARGGRRPDGDFEELLRGALRDEANRQEPGGDGLVRIRERVARRRRAGWLRPAIALAGAAAVVAVVIALPPVLSLARGGSSAPAGSAGGSTSAGRPPATATNATAVPRGPGSAARRTVWPYPNLQVAAARADADVRAGRYPDLTDPKSTAIEFVQAFVGPDVTLTTGEVVRGATGTTVPVETVRPGGSTVPLTTVELASTRAGAGAPYVVVGASSAAGPGGPATQRTGSAALITLGVLPALRGTAAYPVSGTVDRATGVDLLLKVELREPGSSERLGVQSVPLGSATGRRPWSATLAPFQSLAGTGVLAAWAVDTGGTGVGFVAAPTGTP